MKLSEELRNILRDKGAELIGYGTLEAETCPDYPTGVSVALPVPLHILNGIEDGPTKAYYDMYYEWNERLNQIVRAGEQFLIHNGYHAYAMTTDAVSIDEEWRSRLPHKTVATRSGLGWIGKNGLLVTSEFGPAVRISSILTNAPLECAQPVNQSLCGSCSICRKNCPAQAIKGVLWDTTVPREQIVDVKACKKKQVELMKARTGIETDLCGKCFVVCPYTRKYIKKKAQEMCGTGDIE